MSTNAAGFLGIGLMGEPMALNLVRAGIPLIVWTRSQAKLQPLVDAGAVVAASPAEVFERCETVFLMLLDGAAIDSVLARGGEEFSRRVRGRTLIQMGTPSPEYSRQLEADVLAAGGDYVEAPVSGSRKPAEAATLVAMVAGDESTVTRIRPLLRPMCRETVFCGSVPNALLMKLSVNLFLITHITGLAEAVHFAETHGLNTARLAEILYASPLSSDVVRVKGDKLISRDFAAQASVANVLQNALLISDAARAAGMASPLLDICTQLYTESMSLGWSGADAVAVLGAIEARTRRAD